MVSHDSFEMLKRREEALVRETLSDQEKVANGQMTQEDYDRKHMYDEGLCLHDSNGNKLYPQGSSAERYLEGLYDGLNLEYRPLGDWGNFDVKDDVHDAFYKRVLEFENRFYGSPKYVTASSTNPDIFYHARERADYVDYNDIESSPLYNNRK